MKLGLLGKVLGHSMSPEIHGSLFRQEGCSPRMNSWKCRRQSWKNGFPVCWPTMMDLT